MEPNLRPMSTAQLLDRTFSLYRTHFLLFAGIASLPSLLALAGQAAWVTVGRLSGTVINTGGIILTVLAALAWAMLWLLSYALAMGAGVHAVSTVHLGNQTTIFASYRAVRRRVISILATQMLLWLTVALVFALCILVATLQAKLLPWGGSGIVSILLAMLGAGAVIWLGLRLSLAVPACVLEQMGAYHSLQRSFRLSRGSAGRLLLIVLLYIAALLALFAAVSLLGLLWAAAPGQSRTLPLLVLQLFSSFITSAITAPLTIISFCLVYYDQRVRKEAFDLDLIVEALSQIRSQETSFPPATSRVVE